jgi:DNA-binding CsgD family transcriptional regulator
MKINGTIGGNRVGTVGAPILNGTLGPRRLIPGAADIYRPDGEVEISGVDILRAAAGRKAAEMDAMVFDYANDPENLQKWTAESIGILVLDTINGVSQEQTAHKVGVSQKSVSNKLLSLRMVLQNGRKKSNGGKGKPRRRSVSLAQERVILELREEGCSISEIGRRIGVTRAVVGVVLKLPRVSRG